MCADLICTLLKGQFVLDIRSLGIIESLGIVLQIMQTVISSLRAIAGYRTRDRNRTADIGNKYNLCQLVMAPP